jgi:hypothetical protein
LIAILQKTNRYLPYTSTRSNCPTIRSAALPSHFGGIAPFFHCPAINRASAGGSLLGSVPISSLGPMVMVSGRSVLSRRIATFQVSPFRPQKYCFSAASLQIVSRLLCVRSSVGLGRASCGCPWTVGRSSVQHALNADILVDIRPMNPLTIAKDFPMLSLLLGCFR